MTDVVLQMANISKSFSSVAVLRNVSFDVRRGEVHALVGENGAGKSTLMKVLMGVHKYEAGKYMVNGKEVRFSSPADAQRKRVSMIYQEFELIQSLSVAENILVGRMPVNAVGLIKWSNVYEQAKTFLDMLGANIDPRVRVSTLPMNKQQEVAIARALSYGPVVLILDEPTSALSIGEVKSLIDVVKALRDRGVAVVYITHKLDEIYLIADRITILRDGIVICSCETKDIKLSQMIEYITGEKINQSIIGKTEAAYHKPTENILEIKNLEVEGLIYDINLAVGKGEIVGIAGLIGSGKTELAKAICGALPEKDSRRVSGKIVFDSKEINIKSLNPNTIKKKMGIGFVTENRLEEGIIPEQSMLSNVILPNLNKVSRRLLINGKLAMGLALNVIKGVALYPPDPRKLVRFFSGGNQQKIVIGKWLASDAKLLILDEPTRGVDVGARQEIYKVVRKQAKQGVGVLILSSDIKEILEISDRILVMRRGRIIAETLRHEISEDELLRLIFAEGE